jgi:uncharacterized protein YdhG (YjbR/CyaY superfamily)
MMKKNAAKTIDEYLAGVREEDHRRALEKLRKQIKAAAPRAEECISYQMPAFRQNGMLVFFGNASKHCAFYPGSTAIETHKDELKDYELSKGTIRFQPNKPLPAALVRTIVKERLADNERKAKKHR